MVVVMTSVSPAAAAFVGHDHVCISVFHEVKIYLKNRNARPKIYLFRDAAVREPPAGPGTLFSKSLWSVP